MKCPLCNGDAALKDRFRRIGTGIGTVCGSLLGLLAGCVAGGTIRRTLGKMCDETKGVYRCEHCGHEWRA